MPKRQQATAVGNRKGPGSGLGFLFMGFLREDGPFAKGVVWVVLWFDWQVELYNALPTAHILSIDASDFNHIGFLLKVRLEDTVRFTAHVPPNSSEHKALCCSDPGSV